MAERKPKDPFHGFRFKVEMGGVFKAAFRELSGIDFEQTPTEYRAGEDPLYVRKLPGLNKYSNITLKRGITDDKDIWDWRKKCIDGKVDRQDGSIVILDDAEDKELARWEFHQGWPTKLTISGFNATSNDVVVEELSIAHEWIERTK